MGEFSEINDLPLFVDLDGSLIATDSLWESLASFLRHCPWDAWRLPIWVWKGKASFKREIAQRVIPNAALLPYRPAVLNQIQEKNRQGAEVFLATAADVSIATAVADHLGIFRGVLASDGEINLSGRRKLDAILKTSNGRQFEYIGDSWVDVPIWQAASKAIVVDGATGLVRRLKHMMPVEEVRGRSLSHIGLFLRAMRCHQWIKNILLFVPLILAHQIGDGWKWLQAIFAFVSFSLVASSVYITNDILDIESDRSHPTKRRRPFAAGELPIKTGVLLAGGLFVVGCLLASGTLSISFGILVAVYAAASLSYSLYFKRQPILDLVLLAGFYAYRVVLGGIAVDVEISPWLLQFSIFFFLSLAMVKRYADLIDLERHGLSVAKGRFYTTEDQPMFRAMGAASSCASVLVMAMYVSSDRVKGLYSNPHLLLLICPLLLYWIMRIWFIAHRGQLDHDPIMFALRDRVSHAVAVCTGVILFLAV
jgi:4-hydroxybenzoate polyprenyltransferase